MWDFVNQDDQREMIEYLTSRLGQLSNLNEPCRQARDSAIDALRLREETLIEDGVDAPDWNADMLEEVINQYIMAVSGIDPILGTNADSGEAAADGWDPTQEFEWGEWRLERAEPITDIEGNAIGYSDVISKTLRPTGGGAPYHTYSEIPPSLEWPLQEVVQRGIRFLIGAARVDEIDAVCSVPALPIEMNAEEAGRRVLNRGLGHTEWQRQVQPKRVLSITNFIKEEGNIIANSAILYAPPDALGVTEENGTLQVDFSAFLHQRADGYEDHDFTGGLPGDLRPVWLIDGQHRTRGLAQSPTGKALQIPIIVFTDPFSLAQAAKVFAEINTLQAKLDILHTLFMQHRFQISSPSAKRDFRPWSPDDPDTWNSRQNSLAYETAGWLAQNANGPLHNRIQILKSNAPRISIIKANAWVDYTRDWFSSSGPYPPGSVRDLGSATVRQEIENYFQAIVNTCNHQDWPDGAPRWSPNSRNKGVLQFHSSSQALLRLYSTAFDAARTGHAQRPISIKRFEEVLAPLKWADWLDPTVISRYKGSGERPRTSLRNWLIAAVNHGVQYPSEQVMSSEYPSLPGRGLLAPPAPSTVEISGGLTYPDAANPQGVILTSERPVHALANAQWSVRSPDGTNHGSQTKAASGGTNLSVFTLPHEPWMDRAEFITVRVEWSNVNAPPAHAEINLRRPEFTLQ